MKPFSHIVIAAVWLAGVMLAGGQAAFGQAEPDGLRGDYSHDLRVDMWDLALLSTEWMGRLTWGPNRRMAPEMVAHYRLDGDAEDSAGAKDGVECGVVSWVPASSAKVGSGAVLLEGEGYLTLPDTEVFDLPDSMTVSAWVRTGPVDADVAIISKGDSAWSLGIAGATGTVRFVRNGLIPTGPILGQTVIDDGQWHHVAGVYDAEQALLLVYVDGSVDAQADVTGIPATNMYPVWIGADPEHAGRRWQGLLDDIRVFNYVLTANQLFQQVTWHVDAVNGRDTYNGQGRGRAFRTIQRAIDMAADGDLVLVWPGVYTGPLFFDGKAITVRSAADAAVIRAPGDYAVSFYVDERGDSVLENFVIADSIVGIWVHGTDPAIRHVTLVNNSAAMEVYGGGEPTIEHAILWQSTYHDVYVEGGYSLDMRYCCIQQGCSGEGNFSADPLFTDPAAGDYHLQSAHGRFLPQGEPDESGRGGGVWVYDDQTSPCVDAGDPSLCPAGEMMPNGGRLNIGAYGHTYQASRSPWPFRCDVDYDGSVGVQDLVILAGSWLVEAIVPIED